MANYKEGNEALEQNKESPVQERERERRALKMIQGKTEGG
jgi:hypothetical protein